MKIISYIFILLSTLSIQANDSFNIPSEGPTSLAYRQQKSKIQLAHVDEYKAKSIDPTELKSAGANFLT